MTKRCRLCIRSGRQTKGFDLLGPAKLARKHGVKRNVILRQMKCLTCSHISWRMGQA